MSCRFGALRQLPREAGTELHGGLALKRLTAAASSVSAAAPPAKMSPAHRCRHSARQEQLTLHSLDKKLFACFGSYIPTRGARHDVRAQCRAPGRLETATQHDRDDRGICAELQMSLNTATRKAVEFLAIIGISAAALGLLILLTAAATGTAQALAIAGLGASVALIQPIHSYWKSWRSAVRQEQAFETWWKRTWTLESENFRCGEFVVPHVQVIAQCRQNASYTDVISMSFLPKLQKPRPDPPEWPLIHGTLLPKLINDARGRGIAFTNGEQLDMVRLRVSRDPRRRPDSPTTYTFGIAKTTYFKFATMSNSLDRVIPELTSLGGGATLRSRWDPDRRFRFSDVMKLPSPAKIGTASVIVTAEDLMVLHVRGTLMFQVPGGLSETGPAPVHFLGEGMIERDREPDGTFSPTATVRRALSEELGLTAGQIDTSRIVPTGVIFDTERWQPVFCHLIFLALDFADLHSAAHAAADGFEKERLTPLRFDISDASTKSLLLGKHAGMAFASNHAAMAAYFALIYKHGDKRLLKELG